MKRFFPVILALLGVLARIQADVPDDQYIEVYNLIQEADALNKSGPPAQALGKYLEAQAALQKFQRRYSNWNPKVVTFRLNYLTARIAALSVAVPVPGGTNGPAAAPGTKALQLEKPEPGNLEKQISLLNNQIAQYQNTLRDSETRLRDYEAKSSQWTADKGLLEAKLKEALAIQPAAVDPRELARAEEKIKALQKQADLLQASLQQEKAKPAHAPTDAAALARTQEALTETNRKLAEQTEKANTLEQDKKFLQNKLALLSPDRENAPALDATRKALQDANRQLAEQKELSAKLTSEKDALQSRIKSMASDADAASALRAENALLKKQIAELRAAASTATKAVDATRQLVEAQKRLATLQSDYDILRLEKRVLEERVTQLNAQAATNRPAAVAVKTEDASRIKELERQRDDLQKKLEAATTELASIKSQEAARRQEFERQRDDLQKKLEAAAKESPIAASPESARRISELESQLAGLRARLDVFEARQVPFTAEELALFSKPQVKPAETVPKSPSQASPALPASTAVLAAEAQRYFSVGKLDKAEETYAQVLQQDRTNVFTLANLAAIQLERDRLPEAETTIKQALALAPDDAYSLSILGYLKFRQQKYDDALDALSRAAKLDPQNAQIQNYLGTTLAEKGLRGPAETAFRKAIEIDPKYGDAHVNLAVVYISQQPPLAELARWHYQKALAAGHAPNEYLEKMLQTRK